ncbi:MAG TPA: signal recognition particle-docking protein FtsY [Acidimicrobiales bacterium]|nr:signal recognition particle-docking protein FtsY [Acidimicrobiales bacterium]
MTVVIVVLAVVVVLAASFLLVRRGRAGHPAIGGEAGEALARPAPPTAAPPAAASAPTATERPAVEPLPQAPPAPATPAFRERVARAVSVFGAPLGALRSRAKVDEAAFQELEEALLLADVGLPTTTRLLEPLRAGVRDGTISPEPEQLLGALRGAVAALFAGEERALDRGGQPAVWLFVGVNGVGKTTTIGKLAAAATRAGERVVLAAGDTFRAAAGEQLELWAERSGSEIVRGADGADPSSVVFDAIEHGAAVHADLVLADTAGRLHTKTNLMEELKKVRRVADRPEGRVREVLLVLDATTGQNGLAQAREFASAVGVTGIVLTKLDGTAKGGIVLSIRAELGLPIKLVGLGEGAEDLVEFDPEEFAAALFA